MTLIRFYGILPSQFGLHDMDTLHKMAKVALLRSIARAGEAHSAILKEYTTAGESGNKEEFLFFGTAFVTSRKNLDKLGADLAELETRLPRPQPDLLPQV